MSTGNTVAVVVGIVGALAVVGSVGWLAILRKQGEARIEQLVTPSATKADGKTKFELEGEDEPSKDLEEAPLMPTPSNRISRSPSAQSISKQPKRGNGGTNKATIKILCHNIWAHYFVGGRDMHGRLEALANHIKLEGYDVVLVQELFLLQFGPIGAVGNFVAFAEKMEKIGLRFMTDPRTGAKSFMQNTGLAVFSRYPLIHSTIKCFPHTAEPLNQKGVAVVSIDVNEGQAVYHIANFHPDSRDQHSRAKQIAFVADTVRTHLAEVRGDHSNIIIAGDANVCARHEAQYSYMCGVMASVGAPTDLFPGNHEATFPDDNLWLDHMFVSPALAANLVHKSVRTFKTAADINVSDHLGIDAVFTLPASTTPSGSSSKLEGAGTFAGSTGLNSDPVEVKSLAQLKQAVRGLPIQEAEQVSVSVQ